MYHLTTLERSYHKSDSHYNTLDMDTKKFEAFMHAVRIADEKEYDEDNKVIDQQYGFVFNSGLRHTACRVIRIEKDQKTVYLYHENPAIRVLAPDLKNMIEKSTESEAA